MNGHTGAMQERNHSSVSISGISLVTRQLKTDVSTSATGLANYNQQNTPEK